MGGPEHVVLLTPSDMMSLRIRPPGMETEPAARRGMDVAMVASQPLPHNVTGGAAFRLHDGVEAVATGFWVESRSFSVLRADTLGVLVELVMGPEGSSVDASGAAKAFASMAGVKSTRVLVGSLDGRVSVHSIQSEADGDGYSMHAECELRVGLTHVRFAQVWDHAAMSAAAASGDASAGVLAVSGRNAMLLWHAAAGDDAGGDGMDGAEPTAVAGSSRHAAASPPPPPPAATDGLLTAVVALPTGVDIASVCSLGGAGVAWAEAAGGVATGVLDRTERLQKCARPLQGAPQKLVHCSAVRAVACHTVHEGVHSISLHHEQQLTEVLKLPYAPGHHITTLCSITLPTLELLPPDSAAAIANAGNAARLTNGVTAALARGAPPPAGPCGRPEGSLQEGAVVQPYWGPDAWQEGVAAVAREYLAVPSTLYSCDRNGAAEATHLLSFMRARTQPLLGRSEMRYQIETLAVLKLSNPCFGVASIAPRPVMPKVRDTHTATPKKGSPIDPCGAWSLRRHSAGDAAPVHAPMPLTVMAVGGKVLLVEVVADHDSLELAEEVVEAAAEVHAQASAPEAIMRQVFAQLLERPPGCGEGTAPTEGTVAGAAAAGEAERRGSSEGEAGGAEDAAGAAGEERRSASDGGGWPAGRAGPEDTLWTQRVMVRHHDTVLAAGSGCVTSMRHVPRSHRVCCLELFGSVSIFEARWEWGGSHAALLPVSVHRESAWTRACVPLGAGTVAAAMHDQYLAVLRLEEHGPDEHSPPPDRTAGCGPTTEDLSFLTGLRAPIRSPKRLPPATFRQPASAAHSSLPSAATAPPLQTRLACNIRQGVTCMALMRSGPRSTCDTQPLQPLAVFGTAAGAVGAMEGIPPRLVRPLCLLQRALDSAQRDQHTSWPRRASSHTHGNTWCSYSLREPFMEMSPWRARMHPPPDKVYQQGDPGFLQQGIPVDGALLAVWLDVLDAAERSSRSSRGPRTAGDGDQGARDLARTLRRLPAALREVLQQLRAGGLMRVHRLQVTQQ
eukprot:jgi/Ulvmu1/9605/UM054_0035.1